MKKILLIMALIFVPSSMALSEPFRILNLPTGSAQLSASEKSSGKALWSSKFKIMKTEFKGSSMVYIEEDGNGLFGGDGKKKTWVSRSFYYLKGTEIIPYQLNIVYKDESGKIIRTIEKNYDASSKKVYCKVNGQSKIFDMPGDIADKEDLAFCLANFDFDGKNDHMFHLLTHEPSLYTMTAKYITEESVTSSGKDTDCFKLRIIPDLGAANIFGAFVPATYFWLEAKPPHRFVKYEGLESGLGTPYIDMLKIK